MAVRHLFIYFIIWFGNFCGVQIFMDLVGLSYHKQVDIIISKTRCYKYTLKLHKLPWIETHKNLIPTKIKNNPNRVNCYITIINTNIPYSWLVGYSGYTSPFTLFNQNMLVSVTYQHIILFKFKTAFFFRFLVLQLF